jgi:hypothetical protein
VSRRIVEMRVAAISRRCAPRAATMPRRRDVLEAATVSPSFFRPSTVRCGVGVYIDIPESLMIINSCYRMKEIGGG